MGTVRPLPPGSLASFPYPPSKPPLDPPMHGCWVPAAPRPALTGPLGAQPPTGPGSGQGTTITPRLPVPASLALWGPSPSLGRSFSLTVTFLPELPARPPLAEMAPPSHPPTTLSATKTKEVMAFLCPLLLWGEGGSPEPWDGKSLTRPPSSAVRALHWMQRPLPAPHHSPRPRSWPPWLLSSLALPGLQAPAAASSTLLLPSALSLPGASFLSQASEKPWRQQGHVSFFSFKKMGVGWGGEDSGGGSGTISSLL